MAKNPAVLFYTSDFLTGTTLMTYAQRGKYIHLLCLQHQQGHLSEEDFFSICDRSDHKIISKFKVDENGCFFNQRMEEETQKRNAYSESRSNNRAQKTLKNKAKQRNNICKTYDKHMENENEIEIEDNIGIRDIGIIIEYLNDKIGTNYKHNSKIATKNITARMNEGYSVDDFKKVINNKSAEWLGTDFEKFLTPNTLFGTKFEVYLNQKRKKTLDEIVEEME